MTQSRKNRAEVRLATIKRLFARSLNRCAFPGCLTPIVDDETDAMIGEMCHIEGVGKKALRHNKELSKEQRDAYENLILLCSNHHQVIDHDEERFTVAELKKMKAEHERLGRIESCPKDEKLARICIEASKKRTTHTNRTYVNSCHYEANGNSRQTIVNNTTIMRKTTKKKAYPVGSIGSDNLKANYLSYLVDKYAEFAAWGHSGQANFAIMPGMLKKRFKIGGNRSYFNIPLELFFEAVDFVQKAIENTQLGRIKKKQQKLFSSFEEYCANKSKPT